jgi:hypothetical protein
MSGTKGDLPPVAGQQDSMTPRMDSFCLDTMDFTLDKFDFPQKNSTSATSHCTCSRVMLESDRRGT